MRIVFLFLFLIVNPLQALEYQLQVRLDLAQHSLIGEVTLTTSQSVTLNTEGLHDLTLAGEAVTELHLPAGTHALRYRYPLDNLETFALSGIWYPHPERLAHYSLSVTVPEGYQVVSEAETITLATHAQQHLFQFTFPYPLDSLSLIASRHYQVTQQSYSGKTQEIQLETYFLPANAALASTYLQRARDYLQLYEDLLTPYPYARLAIVENPAPSGYAMPTFMLLGSQVLPLPFILDTALGHEILHQWFGNLVYIDSAHGNWGEGLTHYLAEHWYAQQRGEAVALRKKILDDYAAYSHNNTMAVRDFRVRHDKSHSAVGYGKSAMIFHALRQRLGDTLFFAALRTFIEDNRFRAASWHDLQRAFESHSGQSLYEFFTHWLTRTDVPDIRIEKAAQLRMHQGKLEFSFTLAQNNPPYPLQVPLHFYTATGKHTQVLDFNQTQQNFVIILQQPPLRVVLDEDYDLMRTLSNAEMLPSLARLLGSEVMALVAPSQAEIYQPLLHALGISHILNPEDMRFGTLNQHTLLIAGQDTAAAALLFGDVSRSSAGVTLTLKPHPFAPGKVMALLQAHDVAEAQAAAPKLRHYGGYSEVAFNRGVNVQHKNAHSVNGIELFHNTPTRVLVPQQFTHLEDIIPHLAQQRVVFIGEQHTRFEHHLNQWLIIKKLVERGLKVAIGMEMFQQPYQSALDDYLAGKIEEAAFLQQARYFEKWRYDYNLYKIILDYAKQHSLPVIALNIEGEINNRIGREGIDSLSAEERTHLPTALDFTNTHYREDLRQIFAFHPRHNKDEDSNQAFGRFLQAQTVWDESMAERAARFIQENPDTMLVILAGNGHLRHAYGIPQRLHRRTGVASMVIVQDEELEEGIADYILFSPNLAGTETPLLGVFVDSVAQGLMVKNVTDDGPAARAGIQKEDIILSVGGTSVTNLTDLKTRLFYVDRHTPLSIHLQRGEQNIDVSVQF
jgi:aminopeptidase N